MRTILVHYPSGSQNRMFSTDVRDGSNDPYIYLRERVRELGYDMKTADNHGLQDCAWVLFFDAWSVRPYSGWRGEVRKQQARLRNKPLRRDLYAECVRAGMADRVALFLWEARAVCPPNWDPGLHALFPIVFTWHDGLVDGIRRHKIHIPQPRQFPTVLDVPFKERKLLVNISMNKHASNPNELYSARRASIRYFQNAYPDDFDLYGIGWNQPRTRIQRYAPWLVEQYPAYCGQVKNKWDVLPRYRFSLCYENIQGEPGYVTEKIFDVLRCGSVPIYWGAPNIKEFVDTNAFVDRREFKSDADLAEYLVSIDERTYKAMREAARAYLASERFARFLPEAFAGTVIRTLGLLT